MRCSTIAPAAWTSSGSDSRRSSSRSSRWSRGHHAGAGHRDAAGVLDDRRQLVDGLVEPVDDLGHRAACRVTAALPDAQQPVVDGLGHQPGDVAAEHGDLLDQARGEVPDLRGGRDEQRLDVGQLAVHLGHLQLVLEVADRAQALHDHRDVVRAAVVDQQALEAVDGDVGQVGDGVAQQLHALVDGEEPGLAGVHQHGDDELVVEAGGPVDDVDVTVGDRVEGSGADGTPHEKRPYRSRASPYRRSRRPIEGCRPLEGLLAAGRAPPRRPRRAPASRPRRSAREHVRAPPRPASRRAGRRARGRTRAGGAPPTTVGTEPATHPAAGQPDGGEVLLQHGQHAGRGLDEDHRSAPRGTAPPGRARRSRRTGRARRPRGGRAAAEGVEQRLAGAVAGGPHARCAAP